MKRFFAAFLAAMTLLTLTACGGETETPPPPTDEKAETPAPQEPQTPPEPTPEELAAQEIEDLLGSLTLEEKVGQLFFVRVPETEALTDVSTYHLGGYILFSRDMKDAAGTWLTAEQLSGNISGWQDAAAADTGIPLLIGSDEEGGTVTRASRNPNLFDQTFRSPQQVLAEATDHGNALAEDAWEKNSALLALGMNVNLAPVADVSTDPGDFIYDRSLGLNAQSTAEAVASIVTAMSDCGIGSVLKHFPGYGNNADTHTGIALDERPMETFETSDLLPFAAGTEAGGGRTAVLVSHNIVQCMDPDLPASLSPAVHDILRTELGFDGVAMTDDLAMEAVAAYAADGAVAVMALEAGNDLIITSDYRTQIPRVIEAVESGALSGDAIDTACRRVLTWKQDLGLL